MVEEEKSTTIEFHLTRMKVTSFLRSAVGVGDEKIMVIRFILCYCSLGHLYWCLETYAKLRFELLFWLWKFFFLALVLLYRKRVFFSFAVHFSL